MRVECESCRELVTASFALEDGALRATCSACRAEMAVPLGAAADGDEAPTCPKCGARRRGDAACPSCGLSGERMAAYRDASEGAVPESVRAAWTRVTEGWSEPARHDELLQQVSAHRCYAWAAGRYRSRAGDPIADRQRERMRRAAEATLFASATVRPDAAATPYRATGGVLIVLIIVILIGLFYATVIRPAGSSTPQTPQTPSAPAAPLTPGHPASSSNPTGR
jgi:uncharacterized Zn finger protein (UPF0148 family)